MNISGGSSQMKAKRPRMPSVKCPSCGGDAFARTMGLTTLTFRELYYHCRDDAQCGHVFAVTMEARRTIRPSMVAAPLSALPRTTWREQQPTPANDDAPPNEAAVITAPS
jgi:hypothetical protein